MHFQELRSIIKTILKESFGVPEPISDYAQLIKNAIVAKIQKGEQEGGVFFNNIKLEQAGFSEKGIHQNSYIQLPLRAIQANFKIEYGKDGAFDYEAYGRYIKKASSFGTKIINTNSGQKTLQTLNIKLDCYIPIGKNVTSIDINKIGNAIDEFLMHELTHIYEDYQKVINDSKFATSPEIINYAVDKQREVNDNKTWKSFLTAIYFTLPHEMNAKVSEFYAQINNMRKEGLNNEQIINSLKDNYNWNYVNKLISFNADAFVKKLAASLNGIDVNEFLKEKIKSFQTDIADYANEINASLGDKNENLQEMSRMNPITFLKTWEKIFRERGDYMRKKLAKTLSK